MSIFASMIKKETLHLLRDFRTMTVVLIMPLVLLLLFGFAIDRGEQRQCRGRGGTAYR